MNKQYNIYAILLAVLSSQCYSSEKQQNAILGYFVTTAFISGSAYVWNKICAERYKETLPDAPPHFQRWAREILAENGFDYSDRVPLKMGTGWAVVGGSFILVNSNDVKDLEDIFAGKSLYSSVKQKIILADAEYSLLHENKHYYNGDFGKICVINGAILGTVSQATTIHHLVGIFAVTKMGCVMQERYQEREADRDAFMRTSSLTNLNINKMYYEVKAEEVDRLEGYFSVPVYHNCLTDKIIEKISERVDTANQKTPEKDNYSSKRKNRMLFEATSFLSDRYHPSYRSRAELAQECIDKRRAEHRMNFKSSVGAVLRAQVIKK